MLLLYTHAFQSLIFNRIASRRIKEYGLKLIVGDLVYRNKDEIDADIYLSEDNEMDKEEAADTSEKETIFKKQVRALTEEDINSGNYNLFDVVLPLPGYDITYPNNNISQWYEDILNEYDLSSEKLHHNVKTFALAGRFLSYDF